MKNKAFFVLVAAIVLSTGMGIMCRKQRSDTLQFQVEHYHEAYRWKQFSSAAKYVQNAEEFLRKTEAFSENLSVLDYEILRYSVNPDGMSAEVEVIRNYHVLPSVVVEKQRLMQQWQYDAKRKNWYLVSPY